MKISYQRLFKPPEINAENQQAENQRENGRTLSFLLCFALILCCLSWTLTAWYAAQNAKLEQELDSSRLSAVCPAIPNDLRFDCHPEDEVNKEACELRNCCWSPPNYDNDRLDVPYCFYPPEYSLYDKVNSSKTDFAEEHLFQKVGRSGFPANVVDVRLQITCFDKSILRMKILDRDQYRFEVPYTNFDNDPQPLAKCDLEFFMPAGKSLNFQVRRRLTGEVLFDTFNAGAFIYSDQFLQISSFLQSEYVYGLGEHRAPFLKNVHWNQYAFWNADQWPSQKSTNLYGTHPFYINMIPESQSGYGVFMLNSNAMEAVLQPNPAITLRSLGGIFDLFIIGGPKPSQIVEDFSKIVGKPFLPPFWSLGYHQCKFEYGSLKRTKEILIQTQKAGIPIDVQWNDIDYMDDRKDFTFNPQTFSGLSDFVKELHEKGMHYIPIIDPGISSSEKPGTYRPYERGLDMDIFIKNDSLLPFNGRVWTNGQTVWPDFTDPKSYDYWSEMFQDYHNQVPFDGAWIDMNEPSNFYDGQQNGCDKSSTLNHPPYVPRSVDGHSLFHKTICPSAKQHLGNHYDLHNMYGYTEGMATYEALKTVRNKRPFIISRSTFPGYGHFGGHWTGDVLSDWSSLHDSVTGILDFNLLGIPMVGADICGFNGNTTVKLCQRWVQVGAFYPFSRNHNTDNGIDQDPVSLGPEVVEAAKEALTIRYSLLPFLYTLFAKAHLYGSPVLTPTFFHANAGDKIAYTIDNQFFWGNELLIVPVLSEDTYEVNAYLPSGIWYDYRTRVKIEAEEVPGFVKLKAPETYIPLLARGGSIFPSQAEGAKTTTESRHYPFILKVFLDENSQAHGELFWDDGDSLETYEKGRFTHVIFNCQNNQLITNVTKNDSDLPMPITRAVTVSGLAAENVGKVLINGNDVKFNFNRDHQELKMEDLKLDLAQNMKITWE